jgi:hypothetical protein
MGGIGSGRHSHRPIAGRSRPLHIRHWYALIRWAVARGPGSELDAARMHCPSDDAEEVVFQCVLASSTAGALSLRLFLDERLVYVFALTSTAQHLGGVRWWWVCPDCGRRAAVLYAPCGLYWCCRRCANHITYPSSNASDKRLAYDRLAETIRRCREPDVAPGLLAGMGALVRMFREADRKLVLLLKAHDRLIARDQRDYQQWLRQERRGKPGRPRKQRWN